MVTARGAEQDRIAGLDLGADDYVVKPFGFRELVARINAVLRRTSHREIEPSRLRFLVRSRSIGELGRSRVAGEEIACTPKEYGILEFLARDPGATITRQEILDSVWGSNWFGSTKMMDVHVASLRRKLGIPNVVETVRGIGFRLSVPQ